MTTSPPRRSYRRNEQGQAALGLVLAMTLVMVLIGGQLISNTLEHLPLVQNYNLEHLSYRAVASGVDTYLEQVNATPNLISCNTSNQSTISCDSMSYQSWIQVPGTASAGVPEYFMYNNPQLCFNAACTATSGTLEYATVLVEGAAGYPGHFVYQAETAELTPENGFLNNVFWDNYNAQPDSGFSAASCQYDWNHFYGGPGSSCSDVAFGSTDKLYGPLYSNDSIYIAGTPSFEGVVTHDKSCQFVNSGSSSNPGYNCPVSTSPTDTSATDGATYESLPSDDSELEAIAALNGCVYSGPTTISFVDSGGTAAMKIWSDDTPTNAITGAENSSTTNDGDLISTNPNTCMPSVQGGTVNVPTSANGGNGVIYVENASGGSGSKCEGGANPYGDSGTADSQYGLYAPDTGSGEYDCIGDAFVTDSSQNTPEITGQVTLASSDDIIVTGNLEYADCGTTFNSDLGGSAGTSACTYSPNATNDALGLIAENFVLVNRPVVAGSGGYYVLSTCTGTQYGTLAAALCDPVTTPSSNSTCSSAPSSCNLVIDAAILALNGTFEVNNYCDSTTSSLASSDCSSNAGYPSGDLVVYGSIDEDWRGGVASGVNGTVITGFSKNYSWDSRLGYVPPPYYLSPGTPSWALTSSAISMLNSCETQGVWPSGALSACPTAP